MNWRRVTQVALFTISITAISRATFAQTRQSITFGGLRPQGIQNTYSPSLGPATKAANPSVRTIGNVPQTPTFGRFNQRPTVDTSSFGRQRPGVGYPQRRPNRPTTRPTTRPAIPPVVDNSINNQTNITNNVINNNIVNNNVVNNFGGYPGYGYPSATITVRPGANWGPEYYQWQNQWYQNFVHQRHHNWYHGSWTGNGYRRWYAPLSYGANGWGLSKAVYDSGYVEYTNPYMVSGVTIAGWDYSNPIPIRTFSNEGDRAADRGFDAFERARQEFRNRQYRSALRWAERALGERLEDPLAHELYALCLFAEGKYDEAALVLNSLLASAPGWDWTTMVGLYGNRSPYEAHLRRLERFVKARPDDASARFVLAYHYLVCGRAEPAIEQLRQVVELKPRDIVAARMLESLTEPEPAKPNDTAPRPSVPQGNETAPPIDLVGHWKATRQGEEFRLRIEKDGTFAWQHDASRTNSTMQGDLSVVNGLMILESPQGTTMVGRVTPISKDQFHFALLSGSSDEGLLFRR